jgi:hypothetical protein
MDARYASRQEFQNHAATRLSGLDQPQEPIERRESGEDKPEFEELLMRDSLEFERRRKAMSAAFIN